MERVIFWASAAAALVLGATLAIEVAGVFGRLAADLQAARGG